MIWKPIEACSAYEISDTGIVRRIDTQRVKAQVIGRSGYYVVNLWQHGAGKVHYVHRLIAQAFVGPCAAGMSVNHIDGDRLNNSVANLEYLSLRDNTLDQWRNGRTPRGEKSGQAKLTDLQAAEIKRRANAGERTSVLAKEFGVGAPIVSQIKHGTRRRHLSALASLE